jgi:hypothetical protein
MLRLLVSVGASVRMVAMEMDSVNGVGYEA